MGCVSRESSGNVADAKQVSPFSQSISLPPTDTSSISPSPESDLSHHSQLHPSPPGPLAAMETVKSKKELWRDLKVQSALLFPANHACTDTGHSALTRSLTTAYLVPLLYLLTSSQLSVLARLRYLSDIKSTLPTPAPMAAAEPNRARPKKGGWLGYFSVSAMGLSDFADATTSMLPRIPFLSRPATSLTQTNPAMTFVQDIQAEDDAQRVEAERMFLTYSWWVLHEGWKGVAQRVEESVERTFGG